MLEEDVRDWWSKQPAEQREILVAAASEFRLDERVVGLLSDTGCPLGSEDKLRHGRRLLWPDLLRRVILEDGVASS